MTRKPMPSVKPTQLGAAGLTVPGASQIVTRRDRCPRCQAPFQGRPFCAQDGELAGEPFSLGERYTIEERLGAGGMAFVFGGRHVVLGKRVALKVLRPELSGA